MSTSRGGGGRHAAASRLQPAAGVDLEADSLRLLPLPLHPPQAPHPTPCSSEGGGQPRPGRRVLRQCGPEPLGLKLLRPVVLLAGRVTAWGLWLGALSVTASGLRAQVLSGKGQ